ncbi:MAG: transcriptional regulator [Pseudomonadota bacterium]
MGHRHQHIYSQLLRYARKVTRRADEAEDLLQAVLLSAVETGRGDFSSMQNRRWLMGALRKRALFDARTAARRKQREARFAPEEKTSAEPEGAPMRFIRNLPPGLRTTALLVLTGHTKTEIAWLLGLSDATLRRRIADIRQRWRAGGEPVMGQYCGLNGTLAFGRIRSTLLKHVRHAPALLASHDPDGNLFVLTSQNRLSRQHNGIAGPQKE